MKLAIAYTDYDGIERTEEHYFDMNKSKGEEAMWQEGRFIINSIEFMYSAKVFELGSEFGINGGRVSKLSVWKPRYGYDLTKLDNLIIHYDRGWDIEPRDKIDRDALELILGLYPIT